MHYVLHVLMDADCLIKITQAGYKEHVLDAFKVVVPEPVVKEAVVQGSGRAASELIATNIAARGRAVAAASSAVHQQRRISDRSPPDERT